MFVGRNDPCPCGSGKKYKRCHGAAQTAVANPDVARANALKSVDVDLSSRLLAFAKSRFGLDWLSDALDDYATIEGLEVPEREMSLAIPWALHFRRDADDRTVAEHWAEHAIRVSVEQRVLLSAYANAWLSLWEVSRVERGVGAELVDQLTREVRFAHDVSSSGTLAVHDMLLAIILDCDGVSFFGGAHGQPLPPHYAEAALREARKICRVRTRAVKPETLRTTDTQLDIIDAWNASVDMMRAAPPPTLTNTDGDLFAPTTDDFALTAPRAEVIRRLVSMPGATEPEEDGSDTIVVFTKPGNATHRDWSNTVIGRAIVGERGMRVETNSLRRADALRAGVERHLGGMVRHRLRQETNASDMMTRALASHGQPSLGRAARDNAQPPEMLAALRQFREQHMRAWIDDSIPALGGLTPRVAARTPSARRALELLLKDIERSESLLPPGEQIDLAWLRPELGLE